MAGKRRAAPYQLKLLKSSRPGYDSGGRPLTPSPAFRRMAPRPPSSLSREAAAEWRRIVPGLQRLDLLKEEDRAAVTTYCELWADTVDLRARLRTEGRTVTTTTGGVKPNPLVGDLRATIRELRAWVVQLGLSPASEVGLGAKSINDGDDENPFDWNSPSNRAERAERAAAAGRRPDDHDGPGDPFDDEEA